MLTHWYSHVKDRMRSRYRINISVSDYIVLCQLTEYAEFRKQQTTNKFSGILTFKNRKIFAIFTRKGKVVTVLPFNKFK